MLDYRSVNNGRTQKPQLIPESWRQATEAQCPQQHPHHPQWHWTSGCCHRMHRAFWVVRIKKNSKVNELIALFKAGYLQVQLIPNDVLMFQLWNFKNHQTKILWHPHWMEGGVTLCGTTGAWVTCFAATGLSGSRNRKEPPRNKSFACTGVITKNHGG